MGCAAAAKVDPSGELAGKLAPGGMLANGSDAEAAEKQRQHLERLKAEIHLVKKVGRPDTAAAASRDAMLRAAANKFDEFWEDRTIRARTARAIQTGKKQGLRGLRGGLAGAKGLLLGPLDEEGEVQGKSDDKVDDKDVDSPGCLCTNDV